MENFDMRALFNMTYGMYIVSTVLDEKLNGQVANAVMQSYLKDPDFSYRVIKEVTS